MEATVVDGVQPAITLTKEEQTRLDENFGQIRLLNHTTFVLMGLCLLLLSRENTSSVELPVGALKVPRADAFAVLYVAVLALTKVAVALYSSVRPNITLDDRRIPFAWIGTSGGMASPFRIFVVLGFPLLVVCIASFALFGHAQVIAMITTSALVLDAEESAAQWWSRLVDGKAAEVDKYGFPPWLTRFLAMARCFKFLGWTFLTLSIVSAWQRIAFSLAADFIALWLVLLVCCLPAAFALGKRR